MSAHAVALQRWVTLKIWKEPDQSQRLEVKKEGKPRAASSMG